MLTYKVFGSGNVLAGAFPDPVSGDLDVTVVGATPRQTVLRQPDSGCTTTLKGRGLSTDPLDAPTGTVTRIEIKNAAGDVVGEIAGMAWKAARIVTALERSFNDDDDRAFGALWNQQDVTIDMRGRTGSDFRPLGSDVAPFVTSDIDWFGSSSGDQFFTSRGDDVVRIGGAPFGGVGERIYASTGTDIYDFSGVLPRSSSGSIQNLWIDIPYVNVSGPITVRLDFAANIGTVKGDGLDHAFVDVRRAMHDADGFGVFGTAAGDTFEIAPGAGATFTTVAGYAGRDSYDVTLNGTVRVSFFTGYLPVEDWPDQGAVIDLRRAAGQVRNDGFGSIETIRIAPGDGRLEIEGTNNADRVTGSARDERFIPRGGDDTIDGDGSIDRVRYDRAGLEGAVDVDLAAGRATGTFDGVAYTHRLRNIEDVRWGMAAAHNDTVRGTDGANRLDGFNAAGNALIEGRGGNDTIRGGRGGDTIDAGAGSDVVYAGAGADRIIGGTGIDTLFGGEGADLFDFASAAYSSAEAPDRIDDFLSGTDRIDLSDLGASVFIGPAAFTPGRAGQVRYDRVLSVVEVDVGGDGVADFAVRLVGNPVISDGDILLAGGGVG